MDACALPISYKYSKYLFASSFTIGASSIVSAYYKDYVTFLFMFMLFLTSINYWYKPDYGLRRDVDMFLCKLINLYFYLTTLSLYDEYCNVVFVYGFYNALFLYFMEHLYCYFNNKKWIIFHMAIHLQVSFLVPFVLYILWISPVSSSKKKYPISGSGSNFPIKKQIHSIKRIYYLVNYLYFLSLSFIRNSKRGVMSILDTGYLI